MSISAIIAELNENNGSNYKMDVLRKYKDNALLQRVLKMTYDKVAFTYGVSVKAIDNAAWLEENPGTLTLVEALDILENQFLTRNVTGHEAAQCLTNMVAALPEEDGELLRMIVNRDLRINMGRSNINKVFKDLIVKPIYMRCGLFTQKTKSKINPNGAYVQLKADGTYREFTVEDGNVTCTSRSGEAYYYPNLFKVLKQKPDGHYVGELTIEKDGVPLDRATGNGLINSDDIPYDDLVLDLWDYITLEEYTDAANKIKGKTPYHERFSKLRNIIGSNSKNVRVIETHIVNSFSEALVHCSKWMNDGLEGAILKDANAIFRDGTSDQQLKMKLEIDADVRIIGYKPGREGTKREGRIGSIEFETDDKQVRGFAAGLTEDKLDEFQARWDEINGSIMTVTFNDLTKARDNDYYALSHPRFKELRNDKTDTDTLDRIFESKQMAMEVEG